MHTIVVFPTLKIQPQHTVIFTFKFINCAADFDLSVRFIVEFEHLFNVRFGIKSCVEEECVQITVNFDLVFAADKLCGIIGDISSHAFDQTLQFRCTAVKRIIDKFRLTGRVFDSRLIQTGNQFIDPHAGRRIFEAVFFSRNNQHFSSVSKTDALHSARDKDFLCFCLVILAVNIIEIGIASACSIVVIHPGGLYHFPQIRSDGVGIGVFQDISFGNDFGVVGVTDKVNSFSSVFDIEPQLGLYRTVAVSGIGITGRLLIGKDGYGGQRKKSSE